MTDKEFVLEMIPHAVLEYNMDHKTYQIWNFRGTHNMCLSNNISDTENDAWNKARIELERRFLTLLEN
jgi:hypothetical protein